MPREYNRFNWIACVWIAIGLFDLPLGYIIYAIIVYAFKGKYAISITICALAGLIACSGWLAVSIKLNNRYWIRTNWIGALAIFWGIFHAILAVSYFINTQSNGNGKLIFVIFINLLLSAISVFLILSGIYVLRKTDLYRQFRWRD